MTIPCDEAIEILNALNGSGMDAYIIGRSLISKTSKDVDFLVFGSKNEVERALEINNIKGFTNNISDTSDYINTDFPWNSIIKGQNNYFKFDILFCDFETDIIEVLNGFPITMQHIAFKDDKFYETMHFQTACLELSPKRRQVQVGEGLSKVMEKYLRYYPQHRIGIDFMNVLKHLAFYKGGKIDI